VTLPPIEHFRVPIQLDDVTRELYDEMYNTSRERFQKSLIQGGVGHNKFDGSEADEVEYIQCLVYAYSK
jgi:hypothetical protein